LQNALPSGTKLGRDDPCEEDIKICTKEVNPPWGGPSRGLKVRK
jgi:hypothetical protein